MLASLKGNFSWNFMWEIVLILVPGQRQLSHALVFCAAGSSDTNTETLTASLTPLLSCKFNQREDLQ